jgi:peptidase S41-like protein
MTISIKKLLLGLVLFTNLNLFSQQCTCASQFSFVKNYYETNNPAFQKIKANATLYKKYAKEVLRLTREIDNEKSEDRCNIYFERYVALLKDHHSGIDIHLRKLNVDLNSRKTIDSFRSTKEYQSFKKIKIDTAALIPSLKSRPHPKVEGLYTSSSGILIGILETKPDTYIGIVLRQYSLLDVGHILLEFKKSGNNTFNCVFHTGLLAMNFQNAFKEVEIKNGQIPGIGFFKIDTQTAADSTPYSFRELDDSTNYIMLKSFERSLIQELDSFYNSIDSIVQTKPYLIIDLRDNGGGAEACYLSLMKYIYTRPLQVDNVDVWVSPDNIKRYEEVHYTQKLIDRMKAARPFIFIPQTEGEMERWTMDGTIYPKKVAVIFNNKTGSAAEGMITYCTQSSKVITLGENSGGYIGYGDMMTTSIPCGKYLLRSTTTRYHNNAKYEFVGISPMYNLQGKEDWIEGARRILHKQNLPSASPGWYEQ